MKIYFPVSLNIVVPGHIKLIDKLSKKGDLVIGLLTGNALKGYKKEKMPYKDRLFILKRIAPKAKIVAQNTLSPERNVVKYKVDAIASGDGWEKSELEVIKRLNLKKINLKSGHRLHSSDIK